MTTANVWVLRGALLIAASFGGVVHFWVADAGAAVIASLLAGLTALMLGGWAVARSVHAP